MDYFSAVVAQPLPYINSLTNTTWCSSCLNDVVTKAGPIISSVNDTLPEQVDGVLEDKCGKANFKADQTVAGVAEATGAAAFAPPSESTSNAQRLVDVFVIPATRLLAAALAGYMLA